MACSNPNYVRHVLDPDSGQIVSHFEGPGRYLDPLEFGSPESLATRGWYITPVPCGKCPGCCADKAREWSVRMLLELETMHDAIFLTLTYNDAHLPRTEDGVPTLLLRDTQLFLKRLRKHFSDRKIRFVLSGEYGSRTHRPHYHCILFGLSLACFPDLRQQSVNDLGQPFYTSPLLESKWGNGFVLLSGVTFHTCNYVARYTLKKQFGSHCDLADGRKPEFMLTSRRPGIGMSSAISRLSTGNTRFSVDGKDGVFETSIPTSILKRFKESKAIDGIDDLCYNNGRQAQANLEQELIFSNLTYDELLNRKAERLARKLRMLPERR